jgi:hypothetical protein
MVQRALWAAACTGLIVAFSGCGASEADILRANAETASKAKLCDTCGLMAIPDKHSCGKSAFCGPCMAKCQTDKKPWPGEIEYQVKPEDQQTKLASCKTCGQKSLGARK